MKLNCTIRYNPILLEQEKFVNYLLYILNCQVLIYVYSKVIDNSRRYEPTPMGLKTMAALLTLRAKVIKPLLAATTQHLPTDSSSQQTDLDIQYVKVQTEMFSLFQLLGISIQQ